MEEIASKILTPSVIWKDFKGDLPLKESKINEMTYDGICYNEIYFSGRETASGRVRIYGLYAYPAGLAKNKKTGGVLILPDFCDTVDLETVNHYAKQGYCVLMVDYRGESESVPNHTNYPAEIDYANYERAGENLFRVPHTAKETCWYEWVAVSKYALSYLASKPEVGKIGVIGIKQGGNVGWQLIANEPRVSCFVTLFGVGWQAYKGIFKYSGDDKELAMDDERYRYIGGVDAHAYAQYAACPILYLAGTNSPDFDCDRSTDTLARLKANVSATFNFAPRFCSVVDKKCDDDIALFFKKYLSGEGVVTDKFYLPAPSQINLAQGDDNRSIFAEVIPEEPSKVQSISVFVSEGIIDPSKRNWTLAVPVKQEDNKRYFKCALGGASEFACAFAQVTYKNGATISSRITGKKIQSEQPFSNKLLYNSKSGTGDFTVLNETTSALGKIFFCEPRGVELVACANGIAGAHSVYGLLSYKVGEKRFTADARSIIKLDVYCEEFTRLTVTLAVDQGDGPEDFSATFMLKSSKVWQNVQISLGEFKSEKLLGIKDFSDMTALKFQAESRFAVNNILLI